MEIAGCRILVTGATGGIGSAITRVLAERGADLVVSSRSGPALTALADRFGGEAVVADLCEAHQLQMLVGVAEGCDAIVLNAGLRQGTVEEILQVNLWAPIRLASAFVAQRQVAGGSGAVVFTGSVAGLSASKGMRAYNASKFGLRGYALALAEDLADTPMTSTHLVVGYVRDAGMLVDAGDRPPRWVRTSSPDDVAVAVAEALTSGPAERWVTPTALRLAASSASLFPLVAGRVRRRASR